MLWDLQQLHLAYKSRLNWNRCMPTMACKKSQMQKLQLQWSNCSSKGGSFLLSNLNTSKTPKEMNFSELKVLDEFLSDRVLPFSCRARICDQLYEQACARELQDCSRMDEASTAGSSGTVLKDFLSTLAHRHDEKFDSELALDQTPQELSLVLKNVENRGLCLDSSGSNVVESRPLLSPRCSAESLKQHDNREISLDTLGTSSGLHSFQDEADRMATGYNNLCCLQKSSSSEFCKDLQHLFPVAQMSGRPVFNDSERFYGNQLEDWKTVGNGRLFGTSVDNRSLSHSTSAPISVRTSEDLKRHIADSSDEGLQNVKRQKML